MSFTEADLQLAAGDIVFGRGLDYLRYVHGLRIDGTAAEASVQAKRVYVTQLEWGRGGLDGVCSCPHNADGNFCKHLVAVGLAVLRESAEVPAPASDIRVYLEQLGKDDLVDLVEQLTLREAGALRYVEAQAVAAGDAAIDPHELTARVTASLPRGFIDYRESFDAARDIQAVLDELEQLLDAGAADPVRPAAERAVLRTRKILLHADDSGGAIGDACQRAAELHARACREGYPDGRKLARWLAKFRDDSPGWPDVDLAMYVDAFDEKALATYRTAVEKLDAAHSDADHFARFEIDRMLLELADHDGDVDEAIRLLSRDEHVHYGAVVARLHDAGRGPEALNWLDRAVAAGKVSGHLSTSDEYWISPSDAAQQYLDAERPDDALGVLRDHFARRPGPGALRMLLTAAASVGAEAEQRTWAMQVVEATAAQLSDGSALVRIALAEGSLVDAWSAAERYGAGGAWKELADASADDLPVAAADLYRPELDEMLKRPDTKIYPKIAAVLSTMRSLYAKVGEEAVLDGYIADVRETYRRRTSLIAALDRAKLP